MSFCHSYCSSSRTQRRAHSPLYVHLSGESYQARSRSRSGARSFCSGHACPGSHGYDHPETCQSVCQESCWPPLSSFCTEQCSVRTSSASNSPPRYIQVRVWHSAVEPWRLPLNANISFSSYAVKCSTTLSELLRVLGATNPNPARNRCAEMTFVAPGIWVKNWVFNGSQRELMQYSLAEIGWDRGRSDGFIDLWVGA